jgi:16S rRNA (uracil1498-N3)-methyltransferase
MLKSKDNDVEKLKSAEQVFPLFHAYLCFFSKIMNLFFIKTDPHGKAYLDEEEARHCVKVLRHRKGDTIWGIDGQGKRFECQIHDISRQRVELIIKKEEEEWGEKAQQIRLALSPLRKRERFEWAIEKAVELGVTEIVPVLCRHTVKTGVNMKRIEAIARTALKQSKRSRLPALSAPIPLQKFLETPVQAPSFLAYCEATKPLGAFQEAIANAPQISLLIGPEGDFSEEEIEWAQRRGYQLVSLGENRLRTETAAIFAMGIIKYIQGW